MAKTNKRLITAALPYINNIPHLGHIVGSHLPADIFARYCRTKGYETVFIGGTDENGSTSEIAAESIGIEIKEFSDKLHEEHKKIYEWFNISYDIFSRTSKPIHHQTTQEIFKVIHKKGFITPGKMKVFYSINEKRFLPDRYVKGTCPKCGYEDATGDQCEKCTSVLDPAQLINPRSTMTNSPVIIKETQHLFLRLDKLSGKVESWIKKQKTWRSQVKSLALAWIKEGLRERCITRDLKHGVPVPLKGYEDKVLYVWFDAPIGYISATKEIRSKDWDKFWQDKSTDIYNFLGKDNIPFHTIFFPAMLLAHGEFNLPYNVVGLQYLNYEGGKFSKSKKRGVFCEKLPLSGIDVDVMRSYLTFVIPETNDTEFRWEDFQKRINGDLIGNYANLINRTVSFINSRLKGQVKKPSKSEITSLDKKLEKAVKDKASKIEKFLEQAQLRAAYAELLALSSDGNKYFDDAKPWEEINKDPHRASTILYNCASLCRSIAILSSPFTPSAAQKIWNQIGLAGKVDEKGNWNTAQELNHENQYSTKKAQILFSKITNEDLDKFKKIVSDTNDISELFGKRKIEKPVNLSTKMADNDKISYEDFAKLDLRVGKILKVEDHPQADKLYVLTVDLGEEKPRTIVAGLRLKYKKEDLQGKLGVFVANLAPVKLRGIESNGMILAAGDDYNTVVILQPEKDIKPGSKIK
ncbi:MAG: methionine--tRNA ligase [Nanoarchaeota archaeon]|nr:methionine--tRNA ligase [Nanoarchaeota archaeon]